MRKFLNRFVLIFTAILGLITFYIGARLASGLGEWVLILIPAIFLWTIPVVHWNSDADEFTPREIFFQQLSFLSMGLMSWLLVLTFARDLALGLAWLFAGHSEELRVSSATHGSPVLFLALAMTTFGAWVAFRGPRIRRVDVPIEGLPESLVGFKIAQITDLHVGPTIGRAYVEKVVARVREIDPDITVLTGDIVDGNLRDLRPALEPFRELPPRGRVYFATGNHEYYWGLDAWMNEFRALGCEVLLNRGITLNHRGARVYIAGVTDRAATQGRGGTPVQGEGPNIPAAAQGADFESASFRLLLSHRPDPVPQAARAGFHLQLSGHTHGGQFFPWTIAVKFFHRHVLGLHRFEKMWVYVSPGTGSWGPPLRIGTTPEVSCLRLIAANSCP